MAEMYEKVLVSLDSSENSEIILPYAEELARRLHSKLEIVGVYSEHEHTSERLFKSYLNDVVNQLNSKGLQSRAVFLYGNAAEEILNYANSSDTSLIGMATQGRSGISRWILGSVAEKVLRGATKPLLLVSEKRHEAKSAEKPIFRRILVPLDGSTLGEVMLPWAKELARRTRTKLFLLHVILSPDKLTGVSHYAISFEKQLIETLRKQGREYITSVAAELEREKLDFKYDLITGMPADTILDYAKENDMDLIAMSTHGRTGVGRFVLGSVADKVVHVSELPVLLIRAHREQ
jgi:nucleotide-binding universal stress UspA family protein